MTTMPRGAVARRAINPGQVRNNKHTRRAHTAVRNGKPVQVRQATVHTRQQMADAGRRTIATWQAMLAPGPGRAKYAGKVAAGAGAVTAIAAGQVASGVTAVAVGVLVAVLSLAVATAVPQKTRARWKKRWRKAVRPHIARGRRVATKTRQKTRPRKATASRAKKGDV